MSDPENESPLPQAKGPIKTVIYVHGIGNKPKPSITKDLWDQALFRAKMGARTRMAYWADLRYPNPLTTTAMLEAPLAYATGAKSATNGPLTERFSSKITGVKENLVNREAIRKLDKKLHDRVDSKEYKAEIDTRLMIHSSAREGNGQSATEEENEQSTGYSAKVLPGWIRKWATERITRLFLEDVAAYFYDKTLRNSIQCRLKRLLIPDNQPYLIIAHSLGSVIAYDVLHDLNGSVQVPGLITIGSPLGLEEVQDNLTPKCITPPGIEKWYNFSDWLDPVALDHDLHNDFARCMPSGGVLPKDDLVTNEDAKKLNGFNPHSSLGYLSTSEVRETATRVVGFVFSQPITDLVLANDVIKQMSDMTESARRLPVLIELPDKPGSKLEQAREEVIHTIHDITGTKDGESSELNLERCLERYVAADLTADEIERLAAKAGNLSISRIWSNSVKRALIDQSIHKLQARTAQIGYGATGRDIHWAVLDTGISSTHPHFGKYKNIVAEWDCTQRGRPPQGGFSPTGVVGQQCQGSAADRTGHGTHVAGIIAGEYRFENAARPECIGMAPEAKLHVYKVLDDQGLGNDAWIIKALDHIAKTCEERAELAIHGVNLSLGGPFEAEVFGCGHSPICRELRRLWRLGILVCVAAGNEGRVRISNRNGEEFINTDLSIGDPANLEESIAVGSVNKYNPHIYGISYFSSRGPTADGRAKPDVVAPGERICSCSIGFTNGDESSYYIEMSGTSMACPHVSGILAAFLSARREFISQPDRVKELLLQHCIDLRRDRYHQGAGMPNLTRMLLET